MRPAIATVLTASTWETRLVDFARQSATMRILRRCRTAGEVESVLRRIHVVVIGSETPWLTSELLRRWRASGVGIVGITGPNDRPGRRIFEAVPADEVLPATVEPGRLFGAISTVRIPVEEPVRPAPIVTVTGPRGAPGRSEVALALAWAAGPHANTVLVELDHAAPGLGIRLGLAPDALDTSLERARAVGPIDLVALPARGVPMSASFVTRVVETSRARFDAVIIDAGPSVEGVTFEAGRRVLVVQPTPAGLIRAGRLVSSWTGSTPIVVANRVPGGPDHQTALRLVRAATGLEPAVVIPDLDMGTPGPHPVMTSLLEPLARSAFGASQRSAAR